jgi:CRP/FNR family transcriptional regulator
LGVDKKSIVELSRLKLSCEACSLHELCLPRGLDKDELDQLEEIVKRPASMQRGDHLFRPGDALDCLYAVRSGSLKTYLPTDDGDEQILGFHLPGEILGLDAMENDEHTCAAVALETTTVCAMPFNSFIDLCGELPGLNKEMRQLIGHELATEHIQLLMLGKRSAEERLAAFLLSLANRMRARGYSDRDFNLSMSRHDIGNYLGLAVETVSRLFTHFQDQGLLTVDRRHVQLHDMERLKAMVSVGGRSGSSGPRRQKA